MARKSYLDTVSSDPSLPMNQTHAQIANSDPRRCTCHPDDNPPRPCAEKYALTECRTAALADAMWQLLDDMRDGLSVSLGAKAGARVAYEPFLEPGDHNDDLMTLELAKQAIAEADGRR